MADILIRDVPDQIVEKLAQDAERNRRSREKHALFLIEHALSRGPIETAGELSDSIWSEPPPNVISDKEIDEIIGSRGRRSNRDRWYHICQ